MTFMYLMDGFGILWFETMLSILTITLLVGNPTIYTYVPPSDFQANYIVL